MGTGTYAPRRTRASHPDLDHAARRRAATSGVSPRAAAAWVGVTMGGLSRSSLLNWLRDVALRPAGRMRYILSEITSPMVTFLRSVYSFFGPLAPLTGPQLDRRADDQKNCPLQATTRLSGCGLLPEMYRRNVRRDISGKPADAAPNPAGVVEHEHGLRRPLFHPPQKRSLDLAALHDVEGTVDLRSCAAPPGEACYPINVAYSIAIDTLTSSAGHAGKTKPAMLAIDSAATTAASHRRQSNGGSVRT